MKGQYEEACQRIWEAYKLYAYHSFVLRTGHWLVGVTKPPLDWVDREDFVGKTFYERSESDLEHQAKTAWLYSVFSSNFPNFFNKSVGCYHDWWLATVVANIHDTGEMVDIPDDGNEQHGAKNNDEFLILEEFVKAYSKKDATDLLEVFMGFQDRSSRMGLALYALDKLEAVLMLLYLEEHGNCGYITNKPSPTDQDSYVMDVIKTSCATDCWAAHMVACIKDFPQEIVEPVMMLLDVAVCDVRGEEFPWLDKIIQADNSVF